MPQAAGKSTTVSSATQSDFIFLEPGEWVLMVTAGGWGAAALQIGDGATFMNAQDSSGDISFSANKSIVVAGGMCYRLNVTSYSQPITLSAFRSKN